MTKARRSNCGFRNASGAALGKRHLDSLWIFFLLAAGGILLVLAFPHLASAYHLEAAGRSIDNPSSALAHLQRAIDWQPTNAQAYRVLGKVYRTQANWPAAIEALTSYTTLRPSNSLGHIELAETYEMLEAEMAGMRSADLVALLPQAEVAAPDESVVGVDGQTLLMHAPSWVTYTLLMPAQPAMLRFDIGMDPQTPERPGDGVVYVVSVNGQQVFNEQVDEAMVHQGWHERAVDLASWAGQEVVLTLAAEPGPAGNWAAWSEPRVADAQLSALEVLRPGERLVEEWRKSGLASEDLIARGEVSRRAKRYEEARAWYQRAIRLEPDLGDPWHYTGQLYEEQQRWLPALDAYEQAAASSYFRQGGRSSSYYRMGAIYHRKLKPHQLERALWAYKIALATDDFRSNRDAAWVHARLGQIYYARDEDAIAAEAAMLEALELVADDKWLYIVLGNFYRQEDRIVEAAAMYQQALALDPEFEGAQQRLSALRGE